MNKISCIIFHISIFLLLSTSLVFSHLCDNVFRQKNKLIVKPENYNLVVKDEATFKIFLQNNMDREIAEISLLAQSPVFDFTIMPDKMSVPREQRVFFTVTMRPKPGVKTGSYPIDFRLVGGGREFSSFSMNMQRAPAETELTQKPDIANLLIVRSTLHSLQLDGVLDEGLWQEAAVASNFSSLSGGSAIYQTVALITFDQEYLYLGIHCQDEDSTKLTEEDTIEVQLTGDSSGSTYYSIHLAAIGKPSFSKVLTPERLIPWESHNLKFAVARDIECWSAELSIPFTALDLEKPTQPDGKRFSMRIIRTKASGNPEQSYWAADSSGYNREQGLGEFILIP